MALLDPPVPGDRTAPRSRDHDRRSAGVHAPTRRRPSDRRRRSSTARPGPSANRRRASGQGGGGRTEAMGVPVVNGSAASRASRQTLALRSAAGRSMSTRFSRGGGSSTRRSARRGRPSSEAPAKCAGHRRDPGETRRRGVDARLWGSGRSSGVRRSRPGDVRALVVGKTSHAACGPGGEWRSNITGSAAAIDQPDYAARRSGPGDRAHVAGSTCWVATDRS
jgi:hypothetical protein